MMITTTMIDEKKQKLISIMGMDFKDELLKGLLTKNDYVTAEKSTYPNIRKWLQYRIFHNRDADKIIKVHNFVNILGWDETLIKGSDAIYLDCIFSMKIHFAKFVKMFENRAANDCWLLCHFDEVFNEEITERYSECLEALEKFARNTHTIGNYMTCPDKEYQRIKGLKKYGYNDRIECLLTDLFKKDTCTLDESLAKSWRDWFMQHKNRLCLEALFDNDNAISNKQFTIVNKDFEVLELHKKMQFKENEIPYFTAYLRNVNHWIEDRTSILTNIVYKSLYIK